MQDVVRTSFLFDAQQEKLPIRKVPDRPAYVLPRDYGITEFRRKWEQQLQFTQAIPNGISFSRLFVSKTIQECDKLAGKSIVSNRKTINDALFVVPIEKDGDVLQFEITADTFLTAKKPISAVSTSATELSQNQLPDMFPLKYTISMPQTNIYQLRDVYRKLNFTRNKRCDRVQFFVILQLWPTLAATHIRTQSSCTIRRWMCEICMKHQWQRHSTIQDQW